MGKNVTTIGAGGNEIVRSEEDAALLGAPVQDPLIHEAGVAAGQRRKMFDNVQDKLLTFGEAVVNGFTAGWVHETGDEADLRRDVNSTEAFGGDLLGTTIGLIGGGPVRALAQGGEAVGKVVARGLLRQGEKSIATRALMEAGAGSLLATSSAMGHATLDTLIEDKPFAGESVLHAAKLGGLMGAAGGGLIGILGKLTSKGSNVVAGAGVSGTIEDAMSAQEAARASYGEALHFHEAQLGAIKELRRVGKLSEVSDDFIRVRSQAVRNARRAQEALKGMDIEKALAGKDPAAYKAVQREWAAYSKAMDELDDVMSIHPAEREGAAAAGYEGRTSPIDRTGTRPVTPDQYVTEPVTGSQFLTEDVPLGPQTVRDPYGHLTDGPIPVQDVTGFPPTLEGMNTAPHFRNFEGHPNTGAAERALDGIDLIAPERRIPASRLEQTANLRKTVDSVVDRTASDVANIDLTGTAARERLSGFQRGLRGVDETMPVINVPDQLGGQLGLPAAGEQLGLPPGSYRMPAVPGAENALVHVPSPHLGPAEHPIGARGPGLAPSGQTGPFERMQPDFRTYDAMQEAALSDAAGNVAGRRAKMFRDARARADKTQAGGPVDMTQEYTGPIVEGEQPLGSRNPTERIERPRPGSYEPTEVIPRSPEDITSAVPGREDIARKMLADWEARSTVRPWDEAKAKTQMAMNELYVSKGSRMDSARALGILEKDGIRPAADPIGQHMDSIYAMNRAARMAGKEVAGAGSPLKDMIVAQLGNKLVRAVLGNALGGPAGAMLGWSKLGGKLASTSGELVQTVANATAKFVTSTKVRAVAAAATANQPWQYSEAGPIKDPVKRIQEIQFLAANPEGIRSQVRKVAGPAYLMMPELVKAMEDTTVGQVQMLALRAPAIYFDRLGRALQPPQGKMRQFFEFENGVNDLGTLLRSLAGGSLTSAQCDALRAWPAVHSKVCSDLLADPETVQGMTQEQLRQVEMVTGVPLTARSDPMFLVRQQAAWQPVAAPTPPAKAQAYNINPAGAPTPSQANATGRAPGN